MSLARKLVSGALLVALVAANAKEAARYIRISSM
jgi:hypothetical protein